MEPISSNFVAFGKAHGVLILPLGLPATMIKVKAANLCAERPNCSGAGLPRPELPQAPYA